VRGNWRAPPGVAALAAGLAPRSDPERHLNVVVRVGINVILAVSLNLINGFTGLF
jgi:ABC-type branched-subunit amino acid transport system permease subunit